MPAYNLRRFAHPEGLKAISPKHLVALLKPHDSYLTGRGFNLPESAAEHEIDYDQLVEVLMSPDSATPADLLDALYYVHEMADADCMEVLLQEVESNRLLIDSNPDPTTADIAAQIFILDRSILERKHAEQNILKPRSFVYFQTAARPIPSFANPTYETLSGLEGDLDEWYESKKRGRGTKVFVYPKSDGVWFLVRHGDPFKREGRVDGESSSVFYRPEKYDVLVYAPESGEIRMHACGKIERETLRRLFGLHLFTGEEFFLEEGKYTLEPLRSDGEISLVCTDVSGIELVKLKEIHYFLGGAENEVEIRKADDLFAAFSGRNAGIPSRIRIKQAAFSVKFRDSKRVRTVTIRPPNTAHYARDDDAASIEEWLMKRGFIRPEHSEDEG